RAHQPRQPGPGARRADGRGTPDRPRHRPSHRWRHRWRSANYRARERVTVMARTLLVVPTASGASLARTCLGVVRALDRQGVNVGFVKPVAQPRDDGGPDRSAALVRATTALHPPEPLSTDQLEQQLGSGGLDVVLEKAVGAWQPVHRQYDVVVVEGLSPGPAKQYASGLTQALARARDADVLLAAGWPAAGAAGDGYRGARTAESGPSPAADIAESLAERLAITASGYSSGEHERVIGCVVNGVPAKDASAAAQLGDALAQRKLRLLAAVPHRPELTWLRVRDLVRELDPRMLSEGGLVIVPGDRHDVVMAACLAELSGTRLAALLLSVGTEPDPRVWDLTRATRATGLPILVVDDSSYETATRVRDLDQGLPIDDLERIEAVTDTIADALDASWLASLTASARSHRLSPAAFRYHLVEQASDADACLVLPEGTEPRIVQ